MDIYLQRTSCPTCGGCDARYVSVDSNINKLTVARLIATVKQQAFSENAFRERPSGLGAPVVLHPFEHNTGALVSCP